MTGDACTFWASALPLFDSQGVPRGAVCVLIDVTERYEQDRHREQFVSMVSHELRQPLSALTTAVELLAAEAGAVPAVRVAQRQAAHMTRVVDDLLDASRLTRREPSMHVTDVSVSEVVQQAIETVRPICERRQQPITVSGNVNIDTVSGDPSRLRQVFVNLLHNAPKFSAPNTSSP